MSTVWNIDPVHTHVQFSVRHMMVSNVKGRFAKSSGTVTLDESDFSKSKVDVEIDAASLETQEPQRDAHLKSADFLEVAKYPKLTFRSNRITPQGTEGAYTMSGDLTIHGVTHPVSLSVDAPGPAVKDPWGGVRRGFEATGEISRKEWGLVYNQALEAGGVVVGDKVKISLEVELIKAQEKAA
ncbi:MAG: polyisoprenoid-binding protein [Acidobacteria bacterium]|nr:MAG: polyisoprenoid-binding protein [Acidobacteriota bacterium]